MPHRLAAAACLFLTWPPSTSTTCASFSRGRFRRPTVPLPRQLAVPDRHQANVKPSGRGICPSCLAELVADPPDGRVPAPDFAEWRSTGRLGNCPVSPWTGEWRRQPQAEGRRWAVSRTIRVSSCTTTLTRTSCEAAHVKHQISSFALVMRWGRFISPTSCQPLPQNASVPR